MATRFLQRYSDSERMNHWFIALLFFLAALSGLAFFHPSLFFFSGLFGGGTWTRILHPFFGVAMVLAFAVMFFRLWRQNVLVPVDREWVAHSADMLRGNKAAMPPVGKYNAGQKGVFWLMSVCLLLLLVTGFMFWQPWFANAFPILLRRIAVLVHAASAFALVLGVIMHVYAAIWVKGTIRAMWYGTVTRAWAKQHHRAWYKQVAGK